MTNHTPAPWAINTVCTEKGYGIAIDANHEQYGNIEICTVSGTKRIDKINEECECNARLISAAPDMYRALLEITSNITPSGDGQQLLWNKAQNALIKAEGR